MIDASIDVSELEPGWVAFKRIERTYPVYNLCRLCAFLEKSHDLPEPDLGRGKWGHTIRYNYFVCPACFIGPTLTSPVK